MEELIRVVKQEPAKNLPAWVKTAIDSRLDRFNTARALTTHTDLIDPELVTEIRETYPQVIENTFDRVQSALVSEAEASNTLTALERLEYLTSLVELSAGVNPEGWIVDRTDPNVTFITHPNFKDKEKFIGIIKKARERSQQQVVGSGMPQSFGVSLQDQHRFHFF